MPHVHGIDVIKDTRCPFGSWSFHTRTDAKKFVKAHQREGGLPLARVFDCECGYWHFGQRYPDRMGGAA